MHFIVHLTRDLLSMVSGSIKGTGNINYKLFHDALSSERHGYNDESWPSFPLYAALSHSPMQKSVNPILNF